MTAMTLRPSAGGALPDVLAEAVLHADVAHATWRRAHGPAWRFIDRLGAAGGFGARFAPCIAALASQVATAGEKISRLGQANMSTQPPYASTSTSMRRFFARPSRESFGATGLVSAMPRTTTRSRGTPA